MRQIRNTIAAAPLIAMPAILCALFQLAPNAVRAETIYVSSGTETINQVSSAGAVSVFATVPPNSYIEGLAFDSSGNLYAPGDHSDQISKITSDQISKITPGGVVSVFATLAAGSTPTGLAFDASGNLYVAAQTTNQISKITSAGVVSLFATLPTNSETDGLAFDSNGNLYAAGLSIDQISKITSSGVVSHFATLPSGSEPAGLAFDSSGNLYAADFGSGNISKISPDGLTVISFATGITNPAFMAFSPTPEPPTAAPLPATILGGGVLLIALLVLNWLARRHALGRLINRSVVTPLVGE